ncbi:hypothetical protein M23134_01952 [Microscilla marina ATCC 23134]|uniref:Uncharacterized protein n=1 Tax=Microscilla marina ATCC 23134 TaxID=313606 RepID=A1ZCC2_MICM2|nr:hypothetical protein M23134_01952 [Microscilla marina ATCC 23134]
MHSSNKKINELIVSTDAVLSFTIIQTYPILCKGFLFLPAKNKPQ